MRTFGVIWLGVLIYVSGTVTPQANILDISAITSVQWQLDGANLGTAQTSAPYSFPWNTTTVPDGQHTLTAVATNVGGQTGSATVQVMIVNKNTIDIQIK